jgi:hypothetical protein
MSAPSIQVVNCNEAVTIEKQGIDPGNPIAYQYNAPNGENNMQMQHD